MHRAISTAVRPGAFDRRPLVPVKLAAIPIGQPRTTEGLPGYRFGVAIFALHGVERQHASLSPAASCSAPI